MSNPAIETRTVCQIGIVVRDAENAAATFAKITGAHVALSIVSDPYEKAHTVYKGNPSPAQAKLVFINMGNIALEFIQPLGGPSTWQNFLDTKGEGVHHIAFEIKGTDEVVAQLEKEGIALEQQGDYPGGRYTYMNADKNIGFILELLENFGSSEKGSA